jgi:hypothetical protein
MKFARLARTATLILALSIPGLAKADPAGWVGGLFGLSVPNYENTTSRGMYGITGGAKLGSEWGFGGYYLTSSKDDEGATGKFAYDLYGVEFAYHFEGEAAGVFIGGRLGTSNLTAGTTALQVKTSPLHYGAVVGYNKFLNDSFSLGGEVNFFSIPESSATPAASPASVTVKGFTMLNFLASAKFWF